MKNIQKYTVYLVCVGLFVFYAKLRKDKFDDEQASGCMYGAVRAFEDGKYIEAIDGTDVSKGFLYVINNYGGTNTSNLAKFYSGISFMYLKQYEVALRYLESAKLREPIFDAKRLALIGDAYVELNKYDIAVRYFIEAAKLYENDDDKGRFLFKAALAYEAMDDYKSALRVVNSFMSDNLHADDKLYEKFEREKEKLSAHIARLSTK